MSGAEPTAHHTPQGSHSYVFRCIVYILYRIYTPHANQMPQCTCTTCLSAHSYQPNVTQNQCGALRHLGPGCLSGLRVPHVKSVLHGAFVCANRLHIQKRRFPARAGRAVVEPRWPRRHPKHGLHSLYYWCVRRYSHQGWSLLHARRQESHTFMCSGVYIVYIHRMRIICREE